MSLREVEEILTHISRPLLIEFDPRGGHTPRSEPLSTRSLGVPRVSELTCCLLLAACSLLLAHCVLLLACCCLLLALCSVLLACCSLLIAHCSLLHAPCALLHASLLLARCYRAVASVASYVLNSSMSFMTVTNALVLVSPI